MEESFWKQSWLSVIWLILRIWLGWQWLSAGLGKVTGPGAAVWVGSKAPVAIMGFLKGALAKAGGEHPAVQGWYAAFIKSVALPGAGFFTYLIAWGEVLVGMGLILGCLTTVALLAGMFMNLNYMLAGTTSTNPILYTIGMILLIALIIQSPVYKIGIDNWLIPKIIKSTGRRATVNS